VSVGHSPDEFCFSPSEIETDGIHSFEASIISDMRNRKRILL
jgi:hypothetical protein